MSTPTHRFAPALRAMPLLGALSLLSASPAGATTADTLRWPDQAPVLVIVAVPKPWYAPRFLVTGRMRDTMGEYGSLPGLSHKAYSFARADGAFGGLYLWRDREAARTWFGPAWFDRVQRERGTAASVRAFQVVAAVDNTPGGTPVDAHSPAVATLSLQAATADAPPPAGEALAAAVAEDRRTPGLLRRYRVVEPGGRWGVLSLWRDEDAARQRLGPEAGATAEWFDTPVLLPSTLPAPQPLTPLR